jgi:hypothetical protein
MGELEAQNGPRRGPSSISPPRASPKTHPADSRQRRRSLAVPQSRSVGIPQSSQSMDADSALASAHVHWSGVRPRHLLDTLVHREYGAGTGHVDAIGGKAGSIKTFGLGNRQQVSTLTTSRAFWRAWRSRGGRAVAGGRRLGVWGQGTTASLCRTAHAPPLTAFLCTTLLRGVISTKLFAKTAARIRVEKLPAVRSRH